MPFLEEAISVLEEADVGVSLVDLFAGSDVRIPEGQTTFITLRETQGYDGRRVQDVRGMAYEMPTAQLVARARTLALAQAKARQAYDALFISNRTVLGTWYLEIVPEQAPFDMGQDASGRPRYGFNFRADKRPS